MPPIDLKRRFGALAGRSHSPAPEESGAGLVHAGRIAAGLDRLPWNKEIQALREGAASLDFEKTLAEMIEIIQGMEDKLTHVLTINTHLENDLDHSKERIASLKAESSKLKQALARKDEEAPTVRELQIVIEQLLEERNQAELRIREHKRRNETVEGELLQLREKVTELEQERKDHVVEINYLEARQGAVQDRAKELEERAAALEKQSAADTQRIGDLENDLNMVLEEKIKASQALKDAQQTLLEYRQRFEGE